MEGGYSPGILQRCDMAEEKKETNHELLIGQVTAAAVIANDICHIKNTITEIKELIKKMEGEYVTKYEFDPIKKVVYGLVGAILLAVIGGVVAMVLK